MKTRFCLLIAVLLLGCPVLNGKATLAGNNPAGEGAVNVFTTPGLYALTMKWVNEYTGVNPKLKIHVIQDINFNGILNTREGIGFTDDESWVAHNPSNWNMIVGRDIIVPVRWVGNGTSILPPSAISEVGAFSQMSGSLGSGLFCSRAWSA